MKVLYRVTITKMFDPEREMITSVSRVQFPNFSKKRILFNQRNRILKLISDHFGMEAI